MSERGVFAVDRGIWEHDVLADSAPFSRREAWLWLLSEAAWRPHWRRLAGRTIKVGRGQVAASLRFIASKWRWSEPRVRRFLACLISEGMVDATTDAGVSVITVCNYDQYQRVSLPSDATPEVDVDAGATQERRKVEDKEYRESTSSDSDLNTRAHDGSFEKFWDRFPHKVGKQAALKAFTSIAKQKIVEFHDLMAGVDRYIATKPHDRPWCNPATWLNQHRWEDQPAEVPRGPPPAQRSGGFFAVLEELENGRNADDEGGFEGRSRAAGAGFR